MQKIFITGNLGRDPEMRFTPDGTPVTSLSVASTDFGKTTWFRVSVFGKQAEPCNQYLAKGRKVAISGRMMPDENGNPRLWTDKEGTPRASFEVRADEVEFLSGKNEPAEAEPVQAGDPF